MTYNPNIATLTTMPQLAPATLELQFNSIALIMGLVIVLLACYVLPLLARVMMARTHMSV